MNSSLQTTIDEILDKTIIVNRIYRRKNYIEIETKKPISSITIVYKNQVDRDADYIELDNKVFHLIKLE